MRHVTRCKPAMGGGTTDMEIDTIENVLEEEEKEGGVGLMDMTGCRCW